MTNGAFAEIARDLARLRRDVDALKIKPSMNNLYMHDESDFTIAAGIVNTRKAHVVLISEVGLSDSVHTILPALAGKVILLRPKDTHTITLLHYTSPEAGNIDIPSYPSGRVLSAPGDSAVLVYSQERGKWVEFDNRGPGGAAVETFLDLTDTPATYVGQAGKAPQVNAGETALEFVTALTDFVRRDGTTPLTADWDIGDTRRILADGIKARDAAGLRLETAAGILGLFVQDTTGYVGLGHDAPLDPFHAIGAIRAANGLTTSQFTRLSFPDADTNILQYARTSLSAYNTFKIQSVFRDGTGAIDRVVVDPSGNVGINQAIPGALLDLYLSAAPAVLRIVSDSHNSQFNLNTYYDSASEGPYFFGHRARGTVAAPTVVVSGDSLLRIIGRGYSAAAGGFLNAAEIRFLVDGEPDTAADITDMPGAIIFLTTPDGSSTMTQRLKIRQDGHFDLNVAYAALRTANKTGLLIQNAAMAAGVAGGGLHLTGGSNSDSASRAGLWAGATSDLATYTARGTTASGIELIDGTIQFFANTGLTAGAGFSPAFRAYLNTTGFGIGIIPVVSFHVEGEARVQGAEATDAILNLYADQGDDVDDRWRLVATTLSRFQIQSFNTGAWANILELYNFGGDVDALLNADFSAKQGFFTNGTMGGIPGNAVVQIDQSSATSARPPLLLSQADLSEEFIQFSATAGAGNPIDTSALGTYYGKIRVSVNGVFKSVAVYN